MAIYDNNGTTNAELGKVYDNNGTTNTQIGKVYDNNGTTDSLIYSAELVIYKNGAIDSEIGGFTTYNSNSGGTYSTSGTYLTISRPYAGNVIPLTYVKGNKAIDLTSYSTLTFTGYLEAGNGHYVGFDTRSNLDWGSNPQLPAAYVNITATSATSYTLDVSGLSGKYYLWLVEFNTVYQAGGMKLNNIVLK